MSELALFAGAGGGILGGGYWGSITKSMGMELSIFSKKQILKSTFGAQNNRLTFKMLTHHGLFPTACFVGKKNMMNLREGQNKMQRLIALLINYK